MSIDASILDGLESAIDEKVVRASRGGGSTTSGTVTRTDPDGTVWVLLAGASTDTPCRTTTVSVKPGDSVSVEVGGGSARITGNVSSPSTDDETANKALYSAGKAIEDAGRAFSAAEVAEQSAISAVQSAAEASVAADEAIGDAASAHNAAEAAQESADNAQVSAGDAYAAALRAFANLSDVEKVVGTLNWITEHGTYSLTTDDAVVDGKQYYVYEDNAYVVVNYPTDEGMFDYELTTDVSIDPGKTYYTRTVAYTYDLTRDTEVDPGKTYYTHDMETGGYDVVVNPDVSEISTYYERTEHVSYDVVETPDVSEIGTYYERTVLYFELSVDESIQNYIASYLSLTNEGLNLSAGSGNYRAVLAVDGLRIIDPDGNVVGIHGEEIQLGDASGLHLSATASILAFSVASQPMAWFGQNSDGIWEMHINNTYAEDMIRFGDFAFIKRDNGNMSLKWLGA